MSWFSDFFSGGSWIDPVIKGGASIIGATIAADANREAGERASQAAQQQAEAIRQGNALAQQRFEQTRADTLPALTYQKEQIARGEKLTPDQEARLGDVRRTAQNALAVSGLRGSGRATVALVRQSEADFTNNAMAQNRQNANQSATSLSSQYFRANDNAANTDAATGRAVGQGLATAGMYDAQAGLSNANLRGRAIGDIGTIINDTLKEGRRSNYDRRPTEAA